MKCLKDCPLCGNNDMDNDEGCFPVGQNQGFEIRCGNPTCGASVHHESRAACVAAWNRRAGEDV